ncbi:MAG: hypothetical protein ABMB14_28880 [Myxococcota bacterium]
MYTASGGVIAQGASIRQWPTDDDVFILAEVHETGTDLSDPILWRYTCSHGNGCTTATYRTNVAVRPGFHVEQHLLHTSIAVRRTNNSSPIELTASTIQHLDPNCAIANADLMAVSVTTSGATNLAVGTSWTVSSNSGFTCNDRGRTSTVYNGTHANVCYTYAPSGGGNNDQLRCNRDNAISGTTWTGEIALADGGGLGPEDHPSFDFLGGGRIVAGSFRPSGNTNDQLRLHFPDATPPPAEPIATKIVSSTYGDPSGYPYLFVQSNNVGHAVWTEGQGTSAAVRYAQCTYGGAVTCQTWTNNWSASLDTVSAGHSEQHAYVAVDGTRQFVAYLADDASINPGIQLRVWVANRCSSGA